MSAVFRHPDRAAIVVSDAHNLAAQAAAVIAWLEMPGNPQRVNGWTLDLAFPSSASGSTALQKEILPFALIERLVAHRIQLRLSIAPPSAESSPSR